MKIATIDDLGFEFNGMWITNPTVLEQPDHFNPDPTYYGFSVVHTGGGCTAWRKDLPGGLYLLLTDEQGMALPYTVGEEMLLGLYDDAADHSDHIACKTLVAGVVETVDDDAPRSRLID